jgi:hypothetical protein
MEGLVDPLVAIGIAKRMINSCPCMLNITQQEMSLAINIMSLGQLLRCIGIVSVRLSMFSADILGLFEFSHYAIHETDETLEPCLVF